jgi:hypothetical protein
VEDDRETTISRRFKNRVVMPVAKREVEEGQPDRGYSAPAGIPPDLPASLIRVKRRDGQRHPIPIIQSDPVVQEIVIHGPHVNGRSFRIRPVGDHARLHWKKQSPVDLVAIEKLLGGERSVRTFGATIGRPRVSPEIAVVRIRQAIWSSTYHRVLRIFEDAAPSFSHVGHDEIMIRDARMNVAIDYWYALLGHG